MMTSVVAKLISHYRAQAKEARIKADETPDEVARKSLLQIAETWERMAKWEEQHLPHRNQWKDPDVVPPKSPKPYA